MFVPAEIGFTAMTIKCFHIFLRMIIIVSGVKSCDVAEEGAPFQLTYTTSSLPTDSTMLSWLKDDVMYADCPVDTGDCSIVDYSWFSANVDKHNSSIDFNVNIHSVSRLVSHNAKGSWLLKTHSSSPVAQVLYMCSLQVYAKPEQVLCRTTWSTDEATIKCWTNKIYPEAMMMVRRHGEQPNIISCDNTRTLDDPVYFKAECTAKIPTNDLNFKRNDMDVYIYPNTIGSHSDIGVDVSISIDIGYIKCQIELHRSISPIIIALAAVTSISTTAAIILLILCCLKGKRRGHSCPCLRKHPTRSEEKHEMKEMTVLINERNRENHGKLEFQGPVAPSKAEE
ncbi:uncharacterized protein LOC131939409 [Physella acuta]|uniref:uncharacterized protein LOC131939409 n=1 Tax=Physella acuta TaxID=109671 RepID=UPI0027DB8FC2|nr:uncharacterized protein LOC131939409 [Physella acuta]